MQYIVWQKTEFAEDWHRFDAETERELTEIILERSRKEGEIVVTVPIEYTINVKIGKAPADVVPAELPKPKKYSPGEKKEAKVETGQSGPETDKDTGG